MHLPRRSRFLFNLVRTGLLATVLGTAQLGATGITSERLLAAILKHTPESTLVPAGQQLKRAEAAAEQISGAAAFWGVGQSMEPLYASGIAMVGAPVHFKDLQQGMTVLYTNRAGRMVAHGLTGSLPKGWIARGINNDEEDDDLVTKENLMGVIGGAYSEMHSEFRLSMTRHLVATGRLVTQRT